MKPGEIRFSGAGRGGKSAAVTRGAINQALAGKTVGVMVGPGEAREQTMNRLMDLLRNTRADYCATPSAIYIENAGIIHVRSTHDVERERPVEDATIIDEETAYA